ncbi:hypothetical protein [Chryseosolibacter indicus]|uniref:Uncharacterized protein n=1 Tax=Chryseosolibacter indicus TaxID=2782351 RepID=A0ABS5VWM0_9BACT|nr:hypothetical protein [Chryseosolibacter indicus]MBT1705823.1 hypothetical protein [Chryseosolibacter indicus]
MKEIENNKDKKGLLEKDLIVFFLGPFLFFIFVSFNGYQIFYHNNKNSEKKFVILLSTGAAFYFVLIIALFALNN